MFVAIDHAELEARIVRARRLLRGCSMCELRCGADRTGAPGSRTAPVPPCGLAAETWSFKRHISYAEELELLPSYMVYLGGCNFRCRFCVQAPGCFAPSGGVRIEPLAAAQDFQRVVGRGARTINLLGGEPSMHLHTILEIAAAADEPLPLVLNTNMYMTPEVIELLRGVVPLYVADFKFGTDACALRLARIERYWEVVTRNLRLAADGADLIVRHLAMPGHIDCCLRPVARWMAEYLPETRFTLMTSYLPAWRTASDCAMGRCLTAEETREAEAIVAELGLPRSA
jgi:putative pyruvate formate lyase activating enzyme